MNWHFNIPAIVQEKIRFSAAVQAAWKSAVWTVKQGQQKFLAAYRATIDEAIPNWQETWQTDPHFGKSLGEIEEHMKAICRSNGMGLTTWNRYRQAARKALLMGTPFHLAAQNFTVDEARQIAEGGQEVAKTLRHEKNLRHAATIVQNHATILPIPKPEDNVEDYLDWLSKNLKEHLAKVAETFGPEATKRLMERLAA